MAYNQKPRHIKDLISTVYSPAVLVANWYQERISGLQNDVHAVTPGIYGQSGCIEGKTTYKSDYLQPVKKDDPRGAEDFIDVKIIRFRNKMKNKETNIQQSNEKFLNNMTTMTDLQYRILPEIARGSTREGDGMSKKSLNDDLTLSYGNQTNFGLLQTKRCEELQELHRYHYLSETKNSFASKVRVPLSPKKLKCSENS